MAKQKIVIIGAGPAGLTAGYELLRRAGDDYEVVILEESDAIGGISRTVRYHGNRMDIGGHRFFSKDERVTRWWEALMPTQGAPSFDDRELGREKPLVPGGPDPETEERVMLVRTRISRIYYLRKFFDYPISMKMQTFRNLGFGRTMKAGFSYLATYFRKLPETSLENFYINRFGRVLYGMFFEGYTEKLWGRHPSQIDASWGSQRVKGLSVSAVLKDMLGKVFGRKKKEVETSLIEQFVYPKYGPGQLWECAAEDIEKMGGRICRGASVVGLTGEGNRLTGVTVRHADGTTETIDDAAHVISSMPLKDLVAGLSDPALTDEVRGVAAGLPYRDFVTIGLLLDRLNLRNNTSMPTLNDITPDCWIYIQDVGVKLGRIQVFNNWSPYLVKDARSTVWIGLEYFCAEGDDFWNMDEADAVRFAAEELVSMGVIDSAEHILDSHRERVKKAYPAYFDTYDRIGELTAFLNKYDNLWCVGRNGQHRYNNMDHSMATAFEAVDGILSGDTDKTALWNVNTEKSYHESKEEKK